MNFLTKLRADLARLTEQRAALDTERSTLAAETDTLLATPTAENRDLNPAETTRFAEIVARNAAIPAEASALDAQIAEHQTQVTYLESVDVARSKSAGPNFVRPVEPVAPVEVRTLSRAQAADHAKRKLEECPDPVRADIIDKMVRRGTPLRDDGDRNFDGDKIARMLLLTENPVYRAAFIKGITSAQPAWTPEEARAINEMRSMQAYTSTHGGYGVPVFIDPTFIITTSTMRSPILDVARVENITTTAWKGISTAAASWSFDAESAAVSDDSLTLAQPSVTAGMARGFIPFSMEFEDDYPNGSGELGMALEVGYMDLLASALATGAGTNNGPIGIFTALDANTNDEVVTSSDGTFLATDIDNVWADLGERWRAAPNCRWFMNVSVENEIRGFGSGTATSRFTVDQTAGGISLLNGKRVLLSDYAPAYTSTTGAENILVVGDFRQYLVAQRLGMTVELVPVLVDTTTNLPTGERGWFARARIGADSILDTAFRLLQNQ